MPPMRAGLMRAICLSLALLASSCCCIVQCQGDVNSNAGASRGRFNGFIRKVFNSANSMFSKTANAAVRFAVTSTTGDELCYDTLGCFNMTDPWISADRPCPAFADPEEIKPDFYMFTRNSPKCFTVTAAPDVLLDGSLYDGSKPTFFIVHGYLNTGNEPWMLKLKDILLEKIDGNVILVDWGRGSKEQYLKVTSNIRVVGRHISWFARQLIKKGDADPADFHFMGHSLGSHISAYACRNITGCGRITAFDPAGPGFDGLSSEIRLDTDAATFVEAIHTNAKPMSAMGFGMMRPVAHIDFYVNGGVDQPGCETPAKVKGPTSVTEWLMLPLEAMADMITCSHGRAIEYFTEAVRNENCTMWGHKVSLAKQYPRWIVGEYIEVPARIGKCRGGRCVPLGMDSYLYPGRGAFSVTTNPREPYCDEERSDEGQDLATLAELGLL